MVSADRAFFDDPQNARQYEAAQEAVERFEAHMRASVALSIRNIVYPADVAATIEDSLERDPAAAQEAAPQALYAYISADPSLADLAKREKKLQNHFLAFVSRMLAGAVMNEARIRPLRHPALLRSPCRVDYPFLQACANPADAAPAAGDRRNDSARIEIRPDVVIPVTVDGYSIGRLRNVSDHGASIVFDDTQENPPVFERLEEVQLAIQPGYLVEKRNDGEHRRPLTIWEEQRWPFSIASAIENDSAGLVKIGGYYAHMNETALNRARRLRTQIEALMLQLGRAGQA